MSLWLSRIALNPMSGRAITLAADATLLHKAIYSLFPPKENDRILFRVDSGPAGPIVLIQSATSPDFSKLELTASDLREAPLSKLLDLELREGEQYSFRLLARPSKRCLHDFSWWSPHTSRLSVRENFKPELYAVAKGTRFDLRSDEDQIAWLRRKGISSGFRVQHCELTPYNLPAIKSSLNFRHRSGSFTAILFDGVLTVTDPASMFEAIKSGIGTQKAFGFGLLSLARTL